MQISGTLLAPTRAQWGACNKMWLVFRFVPNLTVDGGGKVDGQGHDWWNRTRVIDFFPP